MTTTHVHPDADALAAAAAERLVDTLARLQATGHIPAVALTGGGVGTATLRALADAAPPSPLDWRRVDFYWGDERFVPDDSDDRNDNQAREALLDRIDIDPERIHPMAASDGPFGDDVDAAAAGYDAVLAARTRPIDVVLLGMGGEGHVASVFPHSPAVAADDSSRAVAVRDCPKPPPTRISLTLPEIRRAGEVWLLVAGAAKADAVARAHAGADERDIPAAGARGRRHTRWFLDTAAAADLPPETNTM